MTNKITKLALIGAVLVSMLSAASAQTFNSSHDNDSGYSQQQIQKDRAIDSGNGGGGA
jgi:hypothetical protein